MHPTDANPILSLENAELRVQLRPGLGAKLSSLLDKRTGREWLLPSQAPDGGYGAPAYGDDFSRFDTSGFDECFPNVSEGPCPNGEFRWPDHGEVWSRPWEARVEEGRITTRIEGRAWPYTLTRTAFLEGETLVLEYELENRASRPFPHLWSAHPLLRVTPGMRLLLPGTPREAFVNGASDPALGAYGDRRPWPEPVPGLDLSIVQDPSAGVAAKLFLPEVAVGCCGIQDPATGEALVFHWNPSEVPHLGLWLCYGGWPSDGRPGHLTVALEPCTGMPDALQEAAALGWCPELPAGARRTWSLRLRSHQHWTPKSSSGDLP
jgi:galactose mutarotase-like enzyme